MIEILLGTFNGGAFLEQQINSILEQTYHDWRMIIRDDGSTDNTVNIIEGYIEKYPNKFTLIISENASGSAKNNFMRLIQDASADYVMFCDQDDFWEPDKIQLTYNMLLQLEEEHNVATPILVHTDLVVADEQLEVIGSSFFDYMNLPRKKELKDLIIQNSITGCTVMINKSLLELMKRLEENGPILMHDHVAGILASIFGKVGLLDKPMIKYRQHGLNSVGASDANSMNYKVNRFKRGKATFKKDMEASYEQMNYLLKIYDVSVCDSLTQEMINKYSQLSQKSKLGKISFFIQYRVLKHGLIRKVVQLLWA